MVDEARQSRDPVNEDSMVGMLREVLRKVLLSTDDMLPAEVLAYDRTTNEARVRPLIRLLDTEGQTFARAEVPSVPVFTLGGGGFFVGFHLPPGSRGWLKASDRDLSLFRQSFESAAPGSRRLHSFEDALFIPDPMTGYTIAAEDEQAMVVQSLDGSTRVALQDGRVKVTVGGTEYVVEPTGVTVNGDLQVNGDIDSTGTVTGDADVASGAVSLRNHTHLYNPGPGSPTPTQPPAS